MLCTTWAKSPGPASPFSISFPGPVAVVTPSRHLGHAYFSRWCSCTRNWLGTNSTTSLTSSPRCRISSPHEVQTRSRAATSWRITSRGRSGDGRRRRARRRGRGTTSASSSGSSASTASLSSGSTWSVMSSSIKASWLGFSVSPRRPLCSRRIWARRSMRSLFWWRSWDSMDSATSTASSPRPSAINRTNSSRTALRSSPVAVVAPMSPLHHILADVATIF